MEFEKTWVKNLSGSLENVKTLRCAGNIDLEALQEEWEAIENPSEEAEEHHHKYDAHRRTKACPA